jgi:hypothetical protein
VACEPPASANLHCALMSLTATYHRGLGQFNHLCVFTLRRRANSAPTVDWISPLQNGVNLDTVASRWHREGSCPIACYTERRTDDRAGVVWTIWWEPILNPDSVQLGVVW